MRPGGRASLFVVLFWIATICWVRKDARRRIADRSLVWLATLIGAVPPFLGPLIYMLFRPPEYLEDVRERELELKMIERGLDGRDLTCWVCSAQVEPEFLVCPVCTTRLRQACANCSRPLEPAWQVCPYCETPVVAGREHGAAAAAVGPPHPADALFGHVAARAAAFATAAAKSAYPASRRLAPQPAGALGQEARRLNHPPLTESCTLVAGLSQTRHRFCDSVGCRGRWVRPHPLRVGVRPEAELSARGPVNPTPARGRTGAALAARLQHRIARAAR